MLALGGGQAALAARGAAAARERGRLDRPADRRAVGHRRRRRPRPRSSRSTSRGCARSSGDDRLVTRPPGYVLRVDRVRARPRPLRAADRRGRARIRRRGAKLREALALWRGAPLADLAYEPFAQAEIARLEELRLVALEQRIEADLAAGRHARAGRRARGARRRAPAARAAARPADARALPLGPPGRGARGLPSRAARARPSELGLEPGEELQAARAGDPAAGPGARPAEEQPRPQRRALGAGAIAARRRERPDGVEALLALAARWRVAAAARAGHRRASCAPAERRRGDGGARRAPGDAAGRPARRADRRVLVAHAGGATSCGSRRARTSTCCSCRRSRGARAAMSARSSSRRRATWRCSCARAARCAPGRSSSRSARAWHDWAALELGAWVARATGAPLRLIGAASDDRRGRARREPPARRRVADRPAHGAASSPSRCSPPRPPGRDRARAGTPACSSSGSRTAGDRKGLGRVRERARSTTRRRRPCSSGAGPRPGGLAPPETRPASAGR